MDIAHAEPSRSEVVMENWVLVDRGGHRLPVGRVAGHLKIADGYWAVTSVIVEMSREKVTTLNTVYPLGR